MSVQQDLPNISLKHHKIQVIWNEGSRNHHQNTSHLEWGQQEPSCSNNIYCPASEPYNGLKSGHNRDTKLNLMFDSNGSPYNTIKRHEDKDYIIIKMFWSKTSGHAMESNQLIWETALPPFPTVSYIRHTRPSEKTVDQTTKINFNVTVVKYMQFALYWLNTSNHHQHNDKLPCVVWNTWNQLQHNDNSCHGCMEHLKSTSTQWPQLPCVVWNTWNQLRHNNNSCHVLYGTPEISFNIMTTVAMCCMECLKSTSVQCHVLYGTPKINFSTMTIIAIYCLEHLKSTLTQ